MRMQCDCDDQKQRPGNFVQEIETFTPFFSVFPHPYSFDHSLTHIDLFKDYVRCSTVRSHRQMASTMPRSWARRRRCPSGDYVNRSGCDVGRVSKSKCACIGKGVASRGLGMPGELHNIKAWKRYGGMERLAVETGQCECDFPAHCVGVGSGLY